jgi:facilitated trehalose transporter
VLKVSALCSALVTDRCGRRVLLVTSEISLALSMGSLGGFFYLKEQDPIWTGENLNWLPLSALILFIASYSAGYNYEAFFYEYILGAFFEILYLRIVDFT